MPASPETLETDVLVVGTEAAGATAALAAARAGARVLALSKNLVGKSGITQQAAFTINAAVHPDDSVETHIADTLKGGRYLGDPELVTIMCHQAPEAVRELDAMGFQFGREQDQPNRYQVFPMPGHSAPRGVYHPPRGTTGRELVRTLLGAMHRQPGVELRSDLMVSDLLTGDGRIEGALSFDLRTGRAVVIRAKAVILATGGATQIYSHTTAAIEATGDGFALAYTAGLPLIDMEFVQCYPTCLVWPRSLFANNTVPGFRLNFDSRLLNSQGERFMVRWDPQRMEKSTRDIMTIAMMSEILAGRCSEHGGVYLSLEHHPREAIEAYIAQNYPGHVFGMVKPLEHGLDIRQQPLEVAPFAHFYMGGIQTDGHAGTELAGLYAAGEVTGGIHGANRLSGNSLPQCLVFGKVAGQSAAAHALARSGYGTPDQAVAERRMRRVEALYQRVEGVRAVHLRRRLQKAMYPVMVIKDRQLLEQALAEVSAMQEQDMPRLKALGPGDSFHDLREALEMEFMLAVAEMQIRASLFRQESRGAHYRTDYPQENDRDWRQNVVLRRRGTEMAVTAVPVGSASGRGSES